MEKAKISATQLFVLLILFQLSNSLLLPVAIGAKQDAWLTILIAMAVSLVLFLIYHKLYRYYPNILPTDYMEKIIGKVFGRVLAFLYILFFMMVSARVLRDFGEMLLVFAFPETPFLVVSSLLILVVIYAVYRGIEVIARAGELLIMLMFLLISALLLLTLVSGLIEISNLKPVLEDPMNVIRTVFTETLYVPFGEIIVLTMIFPYVNQAKKVKKTSIFSITVTGFILAMFMALNVSVLGVNITERSHFPLSSTIQSIEVAEFLERLDVFFLLLVVIGGFFKISVFMYGAVIGTASLFNIQEPSRLVYPMGIIILLVSMSIASNYMEHIHEGLQLFTIYALLPFQVIIPVVLVMIAFFKNRKT